MNPLRNSVWRAGLVVCAGLLAAPETGLARNDSVTLISGRPLRGTVSASTPDSVTVTTSSGDQKVDPWNLRRIRFDGEPNDLTSAKTAFSDERYAVCLEKLKNLREVPERPLVQQEVQFFKAMAAARSAAAGGNVSASQAAGDLRQFIESHPGSFHFYEAVDALGDMAMTLGNFDVAIEQYQKTAAGPWPELSFNGKLKTGKAQLLRGDYSQAIASFQATEADGNAEDYAVQSKLVARCLRAKALALTGKPEEGQRLASEVVKNESSKNAALFAHAYNALGVCYLQQGKTKEAIRAFLRTDLLFTIDPESHAEALYYLNELWTKIERPDRAARVRQKLSQRYRNSFWASKIKS